MIPDKETNFVYFSSLIREIDKYRPFWNRLRPLLEYNDISYGFIQNTRDIWCRDYMPIQNDLNEFVQFEYFPDYYLHSKYISKLTIPSEVKINRTISRRKSMLIIDGGNIIKSKSMAILTDKVLTENPDLDYEAIVSTLKKELNVQEIILIPKIPNDMTGHADGMVRFLSETELLVADYSNEDDGWKSKMNEALRKTGLRIINYPYAFVDEKNIDGDDVAKGVYINFAQIGNKILFPQFGIKEDHLALEQTRKLFPKCKVIPIDSNEIAMDGGVLNCITWNVQFKTPLKFNKLFNKGPDHAEQEKFIFEKLDFYLASGDYYLIAKGFEIAWNKNPGKFVGDGELKNITYQYLEKVLDRNPIPQYMVDATIDLILDYMESIGQYGFDMSEN